MKINEKNLCAYATSPTPVDKEGYLIKRGEGNKGFQKRWFVLKGNLLFYFERRGDKEPIGVIILEGCSIELDEMDAQFCFKIMFHGGGNRNYIFCAESQESMEQWMKALACASYDYMKIMVTELKRQLCQLGESTASNRVNNGNGTSSGSDSEKKQPSPLPPPRNKHASSNKQQKCNVAPSRTKVSFKELHSSYGNSILQDRSQWTNNTKSCDQMLIIL